VYRDLMAKPLLESRALGGHRNRIAHLVTSVNAPLSFP
jgi:hypothetical protein